MKLVCTIGTQGFADGRRFYRGDVYEVDDETASTLIAHRYATEYVEPEEEPVVPTVTDVDVDEVDEETCDEVAPIEVVEETVVQSPTKEKTSRGRKTGKR